MPAASQLERIASLIERLGPLAGKTRGMKIEADDWNALVDALRGVLEIERTQEGALATTLEEKYAHREHQHLGEVSVEWLDADLQSRIEGGSNSVALRAAFMELGKKVETLSAEVTHLTSVVEQQQKKLDEFFVKDADRGQLLRGFEDRFTVVDSLRTQFSTMSGQFQGLSQNVKSVLELRKQLTDVAGKPFDLADMNRRVSELQKLSDSMRGFDNVPTKLRDLDTRVRATEDATGVGGNNGLNERLNVLVADVETRFNTKLNERIESTSAQLAKEQDERGTRLKEILSAGLENAKGETVKLVDTQFKASQSTLTAQLDERFRTTGEQLRRDVTTTAVSRVDARFNELDLTGKIKTNFDATRGEIETNLRAQLGESLKGDIATSVAGVEQKLTARIAATESLVAKTNQELPTRVKTEVAGATNSLSTSLSKLVDERVSKVPELLEPAITGKVNAAMGDTVGQLNAKVETLFQQRVGDVNARVNAAVADGLKSLPNAVSGEVQTRLAALKLDDQLNQMKSTLSANLSSQINQSVAELRAKVTTNEAAVGELRGQITVSQRTANEANTRALNVEGKLAETNRDVDVRFNSINTRTTTVATQPVIRNIR